MEEQTFIGRGWSFPPSFSRSRNTLVLSEMQEDINQSLEILLSTVPGERVMHPKYGCDLTPLLYEPLTLTLQTHMKELIETSILLYEPRITPESIELENRSHEGQILIHIEYTIKETNARNNLVYPYYVKEGTNA